MKMILKEEKFSWGIEKLARASFSIAHCLKYNEEAELFPLATKEEEAIKILAENAIKGRWLGIHFSVNQYEVDYVTSGGLNFGWEKFSPYFGNDFYQFYVTREFREGSELLESLKKQGFREEEPHAEITRVLYDEWFALYDRYLDSKDEDELGIFAANLGFNNWTDMSDIFLHVAMVNEWPCP